MAYFGSIFLLIWGVGVVRIILTILWDGAHLVQFWTFCTSPLRSTNISTSDFQSEVGEVFGEIGGELPAKFGRRFSSFFRWESRQKHFPPKLHRKFHHQNFTTRFWAVVGPTNKPICIILTSGGQATTDHSWT